MGCTGSKVVREASRELGVKQLEETDLITQGSLRSAYKLFRSADKDNNGKVCTHSLMVDQGAITADAIMRFREGGAWLWMTFNRGPEERPLPRSDDDRHF